VILAGFALAGCASAGAPTVTGDPGGGQVSFTVTFARPGNYAFHCQYHASAGMAGTFVVS
jgi:plastocyanin